MLLLLVMLLLVLVLLLTRMAFYDMALPPHLNRTLELGAVGRGVVYLVPSGMYEFRCFGFIA